MRTVTLRQAIHQLNKNPRTLVFGVMGESEFAREHIPDSLWLNPLDPALEKHLRDLANDQFRPIILYGLGVEDFAPYQAALKLEALGYQEIFIFAAGLEQWRDEGYATNSSAPPAGADREPSIVC